MFTRRQEPPRRSFFLFGPRGAGKTTWLRASLASAAWYDLVRDAELLRLMRDPGTFTREVEAVEGGWVVIDEVQRHPPLLNEVHDLISRHGERYRFALTGSSARRLRRDGADLLPGRVVNRRFFPLVGAEAGPIDVEEWLRTGGLPAVRAEADPSVRIALLEAYAENYITQEVRIEAAIKRLDAFVRFLEVAALMNGQVVNTSGIARDAAVARQTVQGYFEILVDTLMGAWVPAWRARARVKEIAHPKFYFFDPGVVRSLSRRLREPLDRQERGTLFETLVLHELRAWQNDAELGGDLSYWRTPSGAEVDFVWRRGGRAVGFELKASARWPSDGAGVLADLVAQGVLTHGFGVYLGDVPLRANGIPVWPYPMFLEHLYAGEILPG